METKLYQVLNDLEIEFEKFEHEPFFTCEESEAFYKTSPGAHCKTLFLRNAKKTAYFLAIVSSHKKADLKSLCKYLEQPGGKLSFGKPEQMETFLGVTPGSVTPFGLIHSGSNEIEQIIVDTDMFEHEYVHFHPLRNTATLKLKATDFQKFLDHLPHVQSQYKF